jgi:hypothetical protein
MERYLLDTLEHLREHQEFLRTVSGTGGRASLFIGVFMQGNTGFSLDPTLSKLAAELGIALDFDVYPPDIAV